MLPMYSLKNFPYFIGGVYDGKYPLKVETIKLSNRVCRFCSRNIADGAEFGKNEHSHAISESLGNKHLFCLEECKGCNQYLGKIKQNLINFLIYFRQ